MLNSSHSSLRSYLLRYLVARWFGVFDSNNDGQIDLDELIAGIHMLMDLTKDDFKRIAFRAVGSALTVRLTHSADIQLFAQVDLDEQGEITRWECSQFLAIFLRVVLAACSLPTPRLDAEEEQLLIRYSAFQATEASSELASWADVVLLNW